jgi:8-oxo-dGTP diphosphatase
MTSSAAATRPAPLQVVAAVIIHDATVLTCRRKPGRSAAGLWEFPGGKVEPAEAPDAALRREIREELGVDIQVGRLLLRQTTRVGDLDIDLACYECTLRAAAPTASIDHDLLVWQPLARLDELDWARPDLPMVSLLSRQP